MIACVLCCTSCKKDEKEKKAYDADSRTMVYKVTLNDTVLHFYNVTLSYRGSDCQTHSLELSENVWNHTEKGWGDSLGMRMQFSLKEGVDTTYESAPYIRDKKLDLRIITQSMAVTKDGSGVERVYGDVVPEIWASGGLKLEKLSFVKITANLNRRYDNDFMSLK